MCWVGLLRIMVIVPIIMMEGMIQWMMVHIILHMLHPYHPNPLQSTTTTTIMIMKKDLHQTFGLIPSSMNWDYQVILNRYSIGNKLSRL